MLVILLAIIGIAVGYAALSQNLKLNGTVTQKTLADWNVHFKTGSESFTTKGDINADEASFKVDATDNTKGTFSATLVPNSSVEYKVTVINEGTIDAVLDGIFVDGLDSLPSYIDCTVTPTADDDITLTDGGEQEFTISLVAGDADTLPDNGTQPVSVTVEFDFVQKTEVVAN